MESNIRLQKILAISGIASRRRAEKLIMEGRITINGAIVTQLGTKADPTKDYIKIDGKLVLKKEKPVYLLLNKPRGYVTTLNDDKNRPTVRDLIKGVKERIYPVGRLDINTEGLLLLTNDGILAHGLSHPSNQIPKVYLARVRGIPDEKKMRRLTKGLPIPRTQAGVKIKKIHAAPLKVNIDRITGNNSWLKFVLIEGRKRQIRILCEAIGHQVSKLKRIRYAFLNLKGVSLGKFRHLDFNEVADLRKLIKK